MSITVKQIYERIPGFQDSDMKSLAGNNYDSTTKVSDAAAAAYVGPFQWELSLFFAEQDGNDFARLIKNDSERDKVKKFTGINNDNNVNDNNEQNKTSISMDTSIFDIAKYLMC